MQKVSKNVNIRTGASCDLIKTQRISKSVKDTEKIARQFAKKIKTQNGAVVLFDAMMGAGKTTFISYVVKCLGGKNPSSPTFAIINQYANNIFHADLYRIDNVKELINTDFYEIIGAKNFVFIEWAEKLDYKGKCIRVEISIKEDGTRVFDFTY